MSVLLVFANDKIRCFLFLVNYARMKPDVALKALPILINVSQIWILFVDGLYLLVRTGYEGF